MALTVDRAYRQSIHPFHLFLLAGTVPLFLGVLLSDLAYLASYELQWKNFASWLIVGGLVFGGFTVLWTLVDLRRPDQRGRRQVIYTCLLLAICVLGFINALVHAQDAWQSMPAALILSTIVAMLAIATTGLGYSSLRTGGLK